MNKRPLCMNCHQKYRAVAYHKPNGSVQYRRYCENCRKIRGKCLPIEPRWRSRGYVKKTICDLCGFRAKISSQIVVYHIDGNLNNAELHNLRSICLCCTEVVKRRHEVWRQGDLKPD